MRPTTADRPARATVSSPGTRKRPRHRPDFDRLECRALPTSGITVSSLVAPIGLGEPGAPTPGPDGALYFEDRGPQVLIYPSWTAPDPGAIGRLAPDGSITEVPLKLASGEPVPDAPIQALGPDGNFWGMLDDYHSIRIDRVTPDGVVTWFDPGYEAAGISPNQFTSKVAAGSDGNLWFGAGPAIGRISFDGGPATLSLLSPYPDTTPLASDIKPGPDGGLWFADTGGIGRIARDGTITRLSGVPAVAIAPTADGGAWLTRADHGVDRLSADGTLADFRLPGDDDPESYYAARDLPSIVTEADGTAWFLMPDGRMLGRVDPSGTVSVAPIPSNGLAGDWHAPGSLTIGPDGDLYIPESAPAVNHVNAKGRGAILRLDPSSVGFLEGSASSIVQPAGGTFEGVVASFRAPADAPEDTFRAQIQWGAGNSQVDAPIEPDGRGGYNVVGVHAYAHPGTYATTVEIAEYDPSGRRIARAVSFNGEAEVANPVGDALREITLAAPTDPAIHDVRNVYSYSEFLPGLTSRPDDIAVGPDGALWFTESATDSIGRIDADGTVTEFPTATASGFRPRSIAAGPDGALWFTDYQGDVGRLDPTGEVAMFPTSQRSGGGVTSGPINQGDGGPIVAGPDGALWFLRHGAPWVGRITTDGDIAKYPIPAEAGTPSGLIAGPDGSLWFALSPDAIGRIDADGTLAEFALPADPVRLLLPHALALDPDGNLWFFRGQSLERMTPDGDVTAFPVAGVTDTENPSYTNGAIEGIETMVAAPDGGLWFAIPNRDELGRVAADGSIALVPVSANSAPRSVAIGPDGALWFTESGLSSPYNERVPMRSAIGKLVLTRALDATPDEITATPGATFSGPVAHFTDPNLADGDPGDPASYSASIDWGDGTSSAGSVTSDGDGSFTVSGSHDFALEGSYAVTVTLTGPASSSPLPAASATVVTDEASVGIPGVGFPPGVFFPIILPVDVTFGGGPLPTGGTAEPVELGAVPTPPSTASEGSAPVAVADPVIAYGPVATAAPMVPGAALGPIISTSIAIAAPATTGPATSSVLAAAAATSPAEVTPSATYPLVPESRSASANGPTTPTRRTAVVVANALLRPVASATTSKEATRRARKQVARARPAGPRAISARPVVTPEVRPDVRSPAAEVSRGSRPEVERIP